MQIIPIKIKIIKLHHVNYNNVQKKNIYLDNIDLIAEKILGAL